MARSQVSRVDTVFSEIFFFQLCTSLISLILYFLLLWFVLPNKLLAVCELLYIASAFFDINWLFCGLEDFKSTAIRSVFVKMISTMLIFAFVKVENDLVIYALICSGMFLMSNFTLWPMLKKHKIHLVRCGFHDIFKHLKGICVLFIPLLGVSLYKYMDKLMLGIISGNVEVGLYESAEKLINVPVSLIAALGSVMLPRISNLMGNGKKEDCEKYMRISILFAVALSTAMACGIVAISGEFVPLFYGGGYDKCEPLIALLMLSTVFLAVGNVVRTQFLIPGNFDKVFILSIFLGAIVNLVLNSLLIPAFDSVGASVATVFAEIAVCGYQVCFLRKHMRILGYLFESLPFVVCSIVMMLVVSRVSFSVGESFVDLILKIGLGCIVYGILLFFILYFKKVFKRMN